MAQKASEVAVGEVLARFKGFDFHHCGEAAEGEEGEDHRDDTHNDEPAGAAEGEPEGPKGKYGDEPSGPAEPDEAEVGDIGPESANEIFFGGGGGIFGEKARLVGLIIHVGDGEPKAEQQADNRHRPDGAEMGGLKRGAAGIWV